MTPKKFVSIHNHSGFSPFDGLGYPDEHFQWCLENGLDAHAITEHGHMNSYAHAALWVESWNKSNKDKQIKHIPGVEAYFHPDLAQWKRDKSQADQLALDKKAAKKEAKKNLEGVKTIISSTSDSEDETIEMSNQLTIENEDESKSNKFINPVNRRHHLVLLPKNQQGLLEIFRLVSRGYLEGFYRFPRIDIKMMQEALKGGNVIASSACLAGQPAWQMFKQLQGIAFDNLGQHLLDDSSIMDKCVADIANVYDMMTSVLGKENYYLELQFNKLPAQNLVNRAILEFAKRNNVTQQLVVTCDAHYARPELWREREVYKKLGFMNYTDYNPDLLPKSKDDLKCELYPKNATQVWEEYCRSKENTSFYDDAIICDAIERTHDIAHQVIGQVPPDRTQKFPNEKLIPSGTSSFAHLVTLCKQGLIRRGLDDKPKYIERLKEELNVIKTMKNADYFVSYQKIMELARGVCLCGPGRGSGGGSLVAYVLYITDLDPIEWDLPFSRFLSIYRCLSPNTNVLLSDGTIKSLKDIKIGDFVITQNGESKKILNKFSTTHQKSYKVTVNNTTYVCSAEHEWIVEGLDGKPTTKRTTDLTTGDSLYTYQDDSN